MTYHVCIKVSHQNIISISNNALQNIYVCSENSLISKVDVFVRTVIAKGIDNREFTIAASL